MRTLSTSVLALAFTSLAVCACGSSTSGGAGSISGTVAGTSFTVASQIGIVGVDESCSSCGAGADGGQVCTSTSSGQAYVVILTNRADATCETLQSTNVDKNFASFDTLTLTVGTVTGDVSPGTYAIVAANMAATSGAAATFNTTNASCAIVTNASATSGSITVSAASSTSVSGTFSVTFDTQGTFTGSFSTGLCAVPDGGLSGGNGPCQQ
jgi:hypothetical protein